MLRFVLANLFLHLVVITSKIKLQSCMLQKEKFILRLHYMCNKNTCRNIVKCLVQHEIIFCAYGVGQ
jgi:hypothetical protein